MTDTWDYDLAVGDIDLTAHTGLILAEDAAIKSYLSGITVPDKTGMMDVDVWFRYPEGERRIKYPFITIDFLAINPSFDRWTSLYAQSETGASFKDADGVETRKGMYVPSTSPTLPAHTDSTYGFHIDPYLTYTILYQITVHTRSALHDRYLLSRFMTDVLPPRPFWIGVDADATWRRCELLEMQAADTMETTESGNKRIFRKIYTISMDVEIPQSALKTPDEIKKVSKVHTDVYANTASREPTNHVFNATHTIGEPITVVPPSGP